MINQEAATRNQNMKAFTDDNWIFAMSDKMKESSG